MNLKNKRILITAGSTWVPIDGVRVISNIATGQTGILLAKKLIKRGARVTLVLGPVGSPKGRPTGSCQIDKKIHLVEFSFFDELRAQLKKELRARNYDIIIHSAAVSDFKPAQSIKGKSGSDKPYNLRLIPLPKIAADIRRFAPRAKLALFKLEAGVSDSQLLKRAQMTLKDYCADLVVANRITPDYRAYILGWEKIYYRADSKEKLAQALVRHLTQSCFVK